MTGLQTQDAPDLDPGPAEAPEASTKKARRRQRPARPILVNAAKCSGCRTCQLRCSLRFEGAFVPALAKIQVRRLVGDEAREFDVSITEDCDGCGLCARYCLYGALILGRGRRATDG
jgi:NAD-dependent dihydropyrimidine dehydrogenase PreA subunit